MQRAVVIMCLHICVYVHTTRTEKTRGQNVIFREWNDGLFLI